MKENRDVDELECWKIGLRWEVKSNTICNLLSSSFYQLALLLRTVRKNSFRKKTRRKCWEKSKVGREKKNR